MRTRPLAILITLAFAATIFPHAEAQQWSQEYGSFQTYLNPLSPGGFNDWGRGAPSVEAPCQTGPVGAWCLYIRGGWVQYPVHISGPDGKGYDYLSVQADMDGYYQGCGLALTYTGGSNPYQNWVSAFDGTCIPGGHPTTYHYTPTHQAGQHTVWIWCHEYETRNCHLRVGTNDPLRVSGHYSTFTINIGGIFREQLSVNNLAPRVCATFWLSGSPHHRNVETTIDWGLGPAQYEIQSRDIGIGAEWSEERCKALPPSLVDYQICFRARELDGLKRDLTECRDVSGGIL